MMKINKCDSIFNIYIYYVNKLEIGKIRGEFWVDVIPFIYGGEGDTRKGLKFEIK